MEGATEGSADLSAPPVAERRSPVRHDRTGGPAKRVLDGLAEFALSGLSTMEVLALAVAYVAIMGFLWMSGAAEPERLITHAGFRSAWAIVALALIRPLTWVPYALFFMAFRKVTHELLAMWRPVLRNLVAHLMTVGALAGALWLVALVVEGAVSAILSGLAFVTGSGRLSTLGTFRGDWNLARVAGVAGIVVVIRLILPPLDRDLDLSGEPVLWFASGGRGRFDRIAVLVVIAGSALLAVAGLFLAR